jgi:hypothetical protein
VRRALEHFAGGLVGEGDRQDPIGRDAPANEFDVMTRVFPVPAPARINSGPEFVSTASRWGGFR